MRNTRILLLGLPTTGFFLVALANCVGDTVNPGDASDASTTDATQQNQTDGTVPGIDGGGGGMDAGSSKDSGPACVVPDASASGTLDLTFNNGTKALTGNFYARAATVAPNGSVYVVGSANNCADAASSWDLAILHINNDGSLDPAFTPNGNALCLDVAALDFGFGATMLPSGPLFGGSSGNGNTVGFSTLVSMTEGGAPNTAFNSTGKLLGAQLTGTVVGSGCGNPALSDTSPGLTTINAIAVSPTGKIGIAGSNTVNVCDPNDFIPEGNAGFVWQLNSDGSKDSAFNGGAPLKDGTVSGFYGIAYDATGNMLAVGQNLTDAGPTSRTGSVRRYTPTAGLDKSYELAATGGAVGRSVAVLPDGHIVIAGAGTLKGNSYDGALTLTRLNKDFTVDNTFHGGTPLQLPIDIDGYIQYTALSVLCDGTVLAAGTMNINDAADSQDMALAKILANGTLDPKFGTAGIAQDYIPGAEIPVASAQDPVTGKVIVIGRDTTPNLVIARFNP